MTNTPFTFCGHPVTVEYNAATDTEAGSYDASITLEDGTKLTARAERTQDLASGLRMLLDDHLEQQAHAPLTLEQRVAALEDSLAAAHKRAQRLETTARWLGSRMPDKLQTEMLARTYTFSEALDLVLNNDLTREQRRVLGTRIKPEGTA